jgi:hypothetical protein
LDFSLDCVPEKRYPEDLASFDVAWSVSRVDRFLKRNQL